VIPILFFSSRWLRVVHPTRNALACVWQGLDEQKIFVFNRSGICPSSYYSIAYYYAQNATPIEAFNWENANTVCIVKRPWLRYLYHDRTRVVLNKAVLRDEESIMSNQGSIVMRDRVWSAFLKPWTWIACIHTQVTRLLRAFRSI
jgi:hypothetical protein